MPEEPIRRRREQRTSSDGFRKLNPQHAVFNFLHDYYNIRGAKGTRRLGRWSPGLSRVTLAGATEDDVASGALSSVGCELHAGGLTYDAALHFASAKPSAATPYLWYYDVLASTAAAEPVLHCYCLHEWAMQYWPAGSPPPPSRAYQQGTMPLRFVYACARALSLSLARGSLSPSRARSLSLSFTHTHTHVRARTHTHTHTHTTTTTTTQHTASDRRRSTGCWRRRGCAARMWTPCASLPRLRAL